MQYLFVLICFLFTDIYAYNICSFNFKNSSLELGKDYRVINRISNGSTGGYWVKDLQGLNFFIKFDVIYPELQTAASVISSRIYKRFGFSTPKIDIITLNGKRSIRISEIENVKSYSNSLMSDKSFSNKKLSVVANFLKDWDRLGNPSNNLLLKNNNIALIDFGGTLGARAQGKIKPGKFINERIGTFSAGESFTKEFSSFRLPQNRNHPWNSLNQEDYLRISEDFEDVLSDEIIGSIVYAAKYSNIDDSIYMYKVLIKRRDLFIDGLKKLGKSSLKKNLPYFSFNISNFKKYGIAVNESQSYFFRSGSTRSSLKDVLRGVLGENPSVFASQRWRSLYKKYSSIEKADELLKEDVIKSIIDNKSLEGGNNFIRSQYSLSNVGNKSFEKRKQVATMYFTKNENDIYMNKVGIGKDNVKLTKYLIKVKNKNNFLELEKSLPLDSPIPGIINKKRPLGRRIVNEYVSFGRIDYRDIEEIIIGVHNGDNFVFKRITFKRIRDGDILEKVTIKDLRLRTLKQRDIFFKDELTWFERHSINPSTQGRFPFEDIEGSTRTFYHKEISIEKLESLF